MRIILAILFGTLGVVIAVTPAVLPRTQAFRSHLVQLQNKGTSLTQCLTKVSHPLSETSRFATDVQTVHGLIHKIQKRIATTDKIIKVVMLIPYVGAVAAPVLTSVSTVLQTINNGLKSVTGHIDHIVAVIRSWLAPLKTMQAAVAKVNGHIHQVVLVVKRVETETTKVVTCLNNLPEGAPKKAGAAALEKVCHGLDHIPVALLSPVDRVHGGCTQLENFMHKLHLVRRRKRALPSMSKVNSVLKKIDGAFGPLGKFLDKINGALNKKICVVGAFIKIGKLVVSTVKNAAAAAVKAGISIVKGVVHHSKSIFHKIGHFFHHLFGRRASDGQYYIIVDNDYEARKRGLDLCFSINSALKLVNGVTGGMIEEAQKFIGKLFKGKLGFKIPGLTSDVLNLGNVLKIFNIKIPNVTTLLNVAEAHIVAALRLNPLKQYIDAVPHCKPVLTIG